ncbi:SHOCT-like domain-containing protein, partial [Priestia megaterium]
SKEEDVEFINMIKSFVIDERISLDVAKVIIEKYKGEKDIK